MQKKPRTIYPCFKFATSSNKRILLPLLLFETETCNQACQFIEVSVAYPKQKYKRVASWTLSQLFAQQGERGVEVDFEYNFESPNVMVRIEAKNATFTTLSQKQWQGKLDLSHLVMELASSTELCRMVAQVS